jgi:hypothetical protein
VTKLRNNLKNIEMFGDFRKFEDPKPPPKPQEKLPDTTEKAPQSK